MTDQDKAADWVRYYRTMNSYDTRMGALEACSRLHGDEVLRQVLNSLDLKLSFDLIKAARA